MPPVKRKKRPTTGPPAKGKKPPTPPKVEWDKGDLIIDEVRSLRILVELVLKTLGVNNRQEISMAKSQSDYITEITALQTQTLDKVTSQTTLIGGLDTAIKGMVGVIAALKQQIADLLAGGGDPTVLQPLLDSATAALTLLETNSEAMSAALLEGTPEGATLR